MNLNLILLLKKVVFLISNKEVFIFKMGFKYYNILKDVKGFDENLKFFIDFICLNLLLVEVDFVFIYLLEFNGKIKFCKEIDGYIYDINDVYVC